MPSSRLLSAYLPQLGALGPDDAHRMLQGTPYSSYSPTVKIAAVGCLCTTAVLGCSLALWYRSRRLHTFATPSLPSLSTGLRKRVLASAGAAGVPSRANSLFANVDSISFPVPVSHCPGPALVQLTRQRACAAARS